MADLATGRETVGTNSDKMLVISMSCWDFTFWREVHFNGSTWLLACRLFAFTQNVGEMYRRRPADLRTALGDPRLRSEAAEILRDLIERIVIHPTGDQLELELVGQIAAMIDLAHGSESKKAVPRGTALSATDKSSVKVVAGERNQLNLRDSWAGYPAVLELLAASHSGLFRTSA